jgi:alpha-1,2-mannosyltransferase
LYKLYRSSHFQKTFVFFLKKKMSSDGKRRRGSVSATNKKDENEDITAATNQRFEVKDTSSSSSSNDTVIIEDVLSFGIVLITIRILPIIGIPSLWAALARFVPSDTSAMLFGNDLARSLNETRTSNLNQRARFDIITDCDETFNYWEPTHHLLYGRGLQTWEYSPQYALRSYAYLLGQALLAFVSGAAWGADKIRVFNNVRILLAILTGLAETTFVYGIVKRFGARLGMYTYVALICSAGMAHAAPAFLPSSLTMVGLLFAWGAWLIGGTTFTALAALASAVGLLMGWPFAIVAIIPVGIHLLIFENKSLPTFITTGAVVSTVLIIVGALIDHAAYGKWLIAPWNLIRYNVLGEGGGGQGSNLYGIEPWYYFVQSLLLNFNVLALLAAVSPIALIAVTFWTPSTKISSTKSKSNDSLVESVVGDPVDVISGSSRQLTYLIAMVSQLWLWFLVMSSRPHKEERFMFPVFPLIPLAAAVTIAALETILVEPFISNVFTRLSWPVTTVSTSRVQSYFSSSIFAVAFVFSVSRLLALIYGFSAPLHVWSVLGSSLQMHSPTVPNGTTLDAPPAPLTAFAQPWLGFSHVVPGVTGRNYTPSVPFGSEPLPTFAKPGVLVCVGKEWYRFPSHFFLPEASRSGSTPFRHPDRRYRSGGPVELGFLRSNFTGQLPLPYLRRSGGTREIRTEFNDENKEGPRKNYKLLEHCDFVIDLQLPEGRTSQPQYERHMRDLPPIRLGRNTFADIARGPCKHTRESEPPKRCKCDAGERKGFYFDSVYCEPFLDRETTPLLARAFYIPWYSDQRASYGAYHVLQKLTCDCN